VAPGHARPAETAARLRRLLAFFGANMLDDVTGALCRRYAAERSSPRIARRELEDLRAAVNHFHREGHVREVIKVVLPARGRARERWLTRSEAARLVLAAWRHRERQRGAATERFSRRHVAKFILVALYTGRRASAVTQAALRPEAGASHVDLARGLLLPGADVAASKKRQPPIRLPRRLIAHLRRWRARGQNFAVEWNGAPVASIGRAFRAAARAAGLENVSPHTLRHTAATWLMQRGADPWAAAGYLGLSLDTLLRVYGHHHPDHLAGAWSVFDRPGGQPKPRQQPRHRPATGSRGQKKNKRRRPRRKSQIHQRSC